MEISLVHVPYFFVIKYQLLFSCYVGDCLAYRTGTHVGMVSGSINLMAGGFKFIRPFGTVLLIACLWCVALVGYVNATARIYEHYSGLNGGLAILSGPVFISLFLFLTCLTALLSWEDTNE